MQLRYIGNMAKKITAEEYILINLNTLQALDRKVKSRSNPVKIDISNDYETILLHLIT